MKLHLKTLWSGWLAAVLSFLSLWAGFGGQWSADVLGIAPAAYRPQITIGLSVLTLIARMVKAGCDARANATATPAATPAATP